MTTEFSLHGETVALTRLQCFNYGTRRGYKVTVEFDGIEYAPFEDFWELDDMLVAAGHPKPQYQHRAIIELPHIEAVLEQVDNSYRVQAVTKLDGTSVVTRDEILQARDHRRAEQQERFAEYKGKSVIEQMAMVQRRKAEERQAQRNQRFAHGERLIAWQLNENPYRIIEVNGEFAVTTRRVQEARVS